MANKLLSTITKAIDDKMGEDIVALDLRSLGGVICDYFVICSANSTVQVGAIANGIEDEVLKICSEKVIRVDGLQNALWVAMDYGNIMVHIFTPETRDYYALDELWSEAKVVKL